MRVVKSFRNVVFSLISNFLNIILGIFVQSIFLKTLGEENLGLNTILTSTLSLLSIVELGIGSAIIYNLYEPIVDNNKEKIKSLLKFYKNCFSIIIIIMLTLGILLMPFLPSIIGQTSIKNVYLLYIIFLLDVIFSYTIAYKRSIIYANQKEYIINIIHICYLLIMDIVQIVLLFLSHSYLVFLIVKLLSRVFENIVISVVANKMYPFIKEKNIKPIDLKIKKGIIKNIKALFFHKIAGFIVNSTDTILISIYFGGLVTVAHYSNYNLVISAATTIFNQFLLSVTPSIGNLLTEKNPNSNYIVYKKLNFLNFLIFLLASSCILCLMEPFITIFFGEKYILSSFILISLIIKFFIQGMRRTLMSFKEAAGIYYVDKFIPIWESIINLIASIILLKLCGLSGVFLGTAVSSLLLLLYSYPRFVYKPLFNKTYKDYYKEFIKYILYATIILSLVFIINKYINIGNIYLNSIISLFIAVIIPCIIIVILFRKTDEFKYYIDMLKKILLKNK